MNNVEQDTNGRNLAATNQQTLIQPRGPLTVEEARARLAEHGLEPSIRSWFNGREWVLIGLCTFKRRSFEVMGRTPDEVHTRLAVRLEQLRGVRRG